MLSTASGIQSMLKEGSKHFSGLEEAILRNINACKEISNMTKTSLGPNGMKKMVVNHIDKIFVTSDAATILKELEVQHPAAKMIMMASKMQEGECGDGTNLVITLAGELLSQAESLIKMGLHPSQIVTGYERALEMALQYLDSLKVWQFDNVADETEAVKAIWTSLSSKLQDLTDLVAKLVAKACIRCLPNKVDDFDQDFVRVTKILGGSVHDSFVMNGLIVQRGTEGTIQRATKPRVAIYNSPLDPQNSETKGTVLIKNANELLNYTKTEEEHAEKIVKSIADANVNVVVAGGSVSELMLHFLEKYKMMVVKVSSKFELKRLCKALGATPIARLGAPTEEELGTCDAVRMEEIGSTNVTVFEKNTSNCKLATIVLRGATNNQLDDIERAIDDAVNVYRSAIVDGRFVYGGGAVEIALSQKLEEEANKIKTLDQYAFRQYAQSFDIIPRILIENAGLNANEVLSKLQKLNLEQSHALDIRSCEIRPSSELRILDHLKTKWWAIKLATDAAVTILRVDQIIIAKPAGGPKMPQQGHWDDKE